MKVIPFTIPVPQDDSLMIKEEWLPHFYPHLHRHAELQITAVLRGEGNLLAGTRMLRFAAGDIFIIGPNQPHLFKSDPAFFSQGRKKQVHSLTLFFNPYGHAAPLFQLPEMKSVNRWLNTARGGFKIPSGDAGAVRDSLFQIRDSSGAMRMASFIAMLHFVSRLRAVHALSANLQQITFSEAEGQRLNQIYRFSLEYFREPVSLSQVAAIAHLTVPAFCKYFKKRTGKTYLRFLNELRIAEAGRMLLADAEESIGEIARRSGFRHVTHFNRIFRQITGQSPGHFRIQEE